jgi:GNAT superfamily N-acetyltransferase
MDDAKAIQKIARTIKLPGADWPDWHTLRVIRAMISEGRYYVAETAGDIVGILGVLRRRYRVEIRTLAVKRSFSGQGIGKKLVKFAASLAKRFGLRWITAVMFAAFHVKQFYYHAGFRVKDAGYEYRRKWYEFAAAAV